MNHYAGGAALRRTLAERAEAMAQALAGDAVEALVAIPETLDAVLALRQSAIDAQARMGDAAPVVVAAAEAREAEVVAALSATEPAPVTLPTCAALVAWGAELKPQTSRRARAGTVVTGLEAPQLAALFGKPFERWDAGDLDAMGKLAVQCRDVGRAGMLGGDPQAMMRAGQNVVILHAQSANQPPIFAPIAPIAASRIAADEIALAAAEVPDGLDGLDGLAALRQRIAALEEADATRAMAAVEARRVTLTAAEIAGIEAAISTAPPTTEGLMAALEAVMAAMRGPLIPHLDEAGRASLRAAVAGAAERLAPAVLPDLQARLAALPDTQVGAAEARAGPSLRPRRPRPGPSARDGGGAGHGDGRGGSHVRTGRLRSGTARLRS